MGFLWNEDTKGEASPHVFLFFFGAPKCPQNAGKGGAEVFYSQHVGVKGSNGFVSKLGIMPPSVIVVAKGLLYARSVRPRKTS